MKTTYTTEYCGETFSLTADWGQASDTIVGDPLCRQVADFRHSSSAAMRAILRAFSVDCGDDPDEYEDEIDAAVEAMVGRDVNLIAMAEMLERHGDRFTGNDVDETAQGWLDHDFNAESADPWCEIGVWDASTAADFRDAKLTPAQVKDAAEAMCEAESADWDATDEAAAEESHDWTPCDRDSRYTDGDPIYAACNNDISADEIIEAAKDAIANN